MPASEKAFLLRYAEACEKYDSDASPDERSTIAVGFTGADTTPVYVGDWTGTIAHIKMGANGDLQDLLIRADSALFFMSLTRQYSKGSAVYQAATGLVEGQRVLFSANLHGATAVSERGQMCNPDFDTELTSIGPG